MKNKRLLGIIVALALVVGGSLVYSSLTKQETKTETANKTAKVGVLQFVSHPSLDLIYQGIQDGLAEEGYKGDQVKIDFMNSEGDQSKVATMSKQLVANGNDVVVGIATPAAQGLASATKDLPVIMAAITDPIGANLVQNLEKPGGNITGVSDHNPAEQQVELIKTLTPDVKTVGALYSSSEDNSKSQVEEFKAYAEKAGLKVEKFAVPSTNEIASTVNVMTGKVDAIWVPIDNTIASAFSTVVSSNQTAKKPIYPSATAMVEAVLIGYSETNFAELGLYLILFFLGPLMEELIYMGLFQHAFFKDSKFGLDLILPSVLFALPHFSSFPNFLDILVFSTFGIFCAGLTRYTKSIYPSYIVHVINNIVATLPFLVTFLHRIFG